MELPVEDHERILILVDLLEALDAPSEEVDLLLPAERILVSGVTRDVEGAYWAVIAHVVARLWSEDSGRDIGEIADRLRLALSR